MSLSSLKIVFNGNESLEDLFWHNNEVSIHQNQLHQCAAKICGSVRDLSPEFIKPFFTVKEPPYNLRNEHIFNLPSVRTTCDGTSSIHVRAC